MMARALGAASDVFRSTVDTADGPVDADLTVTDVTVDGSRVDYSVDPAPRLAQYFTGEDFYVAYDVDVSDVPESVLTIPVLAQVCPVAWTAGADVRVPAVDRRFLHSLRRVGSVLCEMYPSFMEGGRVVAESAPEYDHSPAAGDAETGSDVGAQGSATGGAGLLFTGGVDSLSSYVRHREADPTLINIRGWLVGADEDERWHHAQAAVERYGERFGAETQFVRSNMLDVLETSTLSVRYSDEIPGGWYSAVGGGLGMLGLCAPLTVAEDIGRLYVAATHWEGFPTHDAYDYWDGQAIPWGSHPDLDEHVAWAETEVVHDGFERTRQERVASIAAFVREGHDDLPVRACEDSATAGNCNRCEKCFRTAVGLAFAGLDPNDHGFDLDTADFAHARERLESGDWLPDHQEYGYWQEFGRLARDRSDLPVADDELLAWLRATDFARVAGKPYTSRALRAVARRLPYPVFARARRVYSQVSNRFE